MACRLCLHVFENDSEYSEMVQHQDQEFLINFLFEVLDMEISSHPLICTPCKVFTEKIHKFLEDCLNAQNRLYEYIRESGCNKLSNNDLVRIAKEHNPQKNPESTSTSPGSSPFLETTDSNSTDSRDSRYYLSVNNSEIANSNLFQYIIEVPQEVPGSENIITVEPCLSSPSEDLEPCEDIHLKMMEHDQFGSGLGGPCISSYDIDEQQENNLDSNILYSKLADSEILSEITIYNEDQQENQNFNQSLSNNISISNLDASDYDKCDPKMFSLSQNEEILELQQSEADMFDCGQNNTGMLEYGQSDILGYDNMTADLMDYTEILGHDKMTTVNLEGLGNSNQTATEDFVNRKTDERIGLKNAFENFVCDQCGAPFKTKRGLTSHVIQKHSRAEIHTCSLCGYETNYKKHFEKHMKYHDSDNPVKMHQCPHCTYKTPRKDTLTIHIKFVHTKKSELELLKCQLCDYQTVRKRNLTSHMKYKHSQAGELEVLHCSYCQYQTVRKKYLQYHLKYQHNQNGKLKLHVCQNCDFKTFKEDRLRLHFKQEHPDGDNLKLHRCAICGYETIRKASLKLHVKCKHRNTNKSEEFACSYCTFRTHRRDAYRKHVRFVHYEQEEGDVEIYKCEVCDYQTVRKVDFQRHVKFKHGDKGH